MPVGWPDWIPDKNRLAELARYVSPFAVGELGLIPPGLRSLAGEDDYQYVAYRQLNALYDALKSKRIALSQPHWRTEISLLGATARSQRIRPPAEVITGPAARLDIALVFAAMMLDIGQRVFLLVGEDRLDRPLICADLRRRLSDEHGRRPPPGFVESAAGIFGYEGGKETGRPAVSKLTRDRGWLVLDPSCAGVGPDLPVPFEQAAGDAILAEFGRGPDAGQGWYLADIDRLRRDAVFYEPPRGLAVPVIFSYLPASPPFVEYRSRSELLTRLAKIARPGGPPTVLVLHGPSGIGKSMIALHLAAEVDFGCGWALNAIDAVALRTSLARAEAAEYASAADAQDAASTRALAAAALHRLSDSQAQWVVILDKFDSAPDAPGLVPLIPSPHENGQLLIITTTHDGWRDYAEQANWAWESVPPLTDQDLVSLGIPERLSGAVAGLPLVAHAYSALPGTAGSRDFQGAGASDGVSFAWELLLRDELDPRAVRLARTMAWCPSDPVRLDAILAIADLGADLVAVETLARAQFIGWQGVTGSPSIQMHQLIARAIREQTWLDEPPAAAEVSRNLLLAPAGQALLAEAADGTALTRLEQEAGRVLAYLPAPEDRGLLWYGLGAARTARGPVREAAAHFGHVLESLDAATWPNETAASLIGLARAIYQSPGSAADALRAAQENLATARDILTRRSNMESRELRAQGNALAVLVGRKVLKEITDDQARETSRRELLELSWESYEERVRIAVGLPAEAVVGRQPPQLEWGAAPDRAYFNLAGFYVQLAKDSDDDLERTKEYLDLAGNIYAHCRRLREQRDEGAASPELAACVNGEAIVAYYQAVSFRQAHRIVDAIERAGAAVAMRSELASSFASEDPASLLGDGDVQKSMQLLLKALVVGFWLADTGAGLSRSAAALEEARRELGIEGRVEPASGQSD